MSCRKSAVRFSCILLFSIALAIALRERTSEWAVAHAMELGAQEQVVDRGYTVTATRPVEQLATLMERRYASPVTYEDPMWEFQGDLEGGAKFPKYLTFVVPAELTPARRPKLDAEVLDEAIAAYHSQTGGPSYKIATSRLGLHLIPDQVRGVDGTFATARNPLDSMVNMPITLRSLNQHVQDLCAALSAATGDRIIYLPDWQSDRAGYKDLTVAWGARDISAREALINLLEPSAATLHWHLNCLSGRLCFFQVEPINLRRPVLVVGPHPMPLTQIPMLPLDWCADCNRPALDFLPLLAPLPVVVK
jgi:hypothetical protein